MELPTEPSLDELFEYHNEHVLSRYRHDYPNSKFTPTEAFHELMKYMWVTQKLNQDKARYPDKYPAYLKIGMQYEMREIDDMWHTFILFTKDYMAFGEKYFGKYFHHQPTADAEKEKISQHADEYLENNVRLQLEYIAEHLGEETLLKWFSCYFENMQHI